MAVQKPTYGRLASQNSNLSGNQETPHHSKYDARLSRTVPPVNSQKALTSSENAHIEIPPSRSDDRAHDDASSGIGALATLHIRASINGDVYFHKFYRRREWPGGILNEKCAHYSDAFTPFAGSSPVTLICDRGQGGVLLAVVNQ